jgi:hypothetical protein
MTVRQNAEVIFDGEPIGLTTDLVMPAAAGFEEAKSELMANKI